MSELYETASLPETMVARLKELAELPGMKVHPIPAVIPPLDQRHILDAARDMVPRLTLDRLTTIAELSPKHPSVDGVAWLDFETVVYYTAGSANFASIGTFSSTPPPFDPFMRLTLAHPPTGNGALVTCRATSIAVGPHYPGYYRVEGPSIAASFEDNARPTTFMFVVPAGGSGPIEIKIHTDFDRIALWAFEDCTITQI